MPFIGNNETATLLCSLNCAVSVTYVLIKRFQLFRSGILVVVGK